MSSLESILDVLAEHNPWWLDGKRPQVEAYRRATTEGLARALTSERWERFLMLLGPRRVGKTTAMEQALDDLLAQGVDPHRLAWIRLDHPQLVREELGSVIRAIPGFATATRERPLYLFLDELTYAPDWDRWLKTFHDDKWPVRILGTSSSTAWLRTGQESGAGRWSHLYMTPVLFGEALELLGQAALPAPPVPEGEPSLGRYLSEFFHLPLPPGYGSVLLKFFVLLGGFPRLLKDPQFRDPSRLEGSLRHAQSMLRDDVVDRVVYKDIPQFFEVRSPLELEKLVAVMGSRLAGIFSAQDISGDVSLSRMAVENYSKYLEAAYLIFFLTGYGGSEGTVQRRGRKLYFVDAAVRNAALLRGVRPLHDATELGHLYENAAASHLWAFATQAGVRVHHYREGKAEVDLILDHPNDPWAFEVASSDKHSTAGLVAFEQKYKKFAGRCVLLAPAAAMSGPRAPQPGVPGLLPLESFLTACTWATRDAALDRLSVFLPPKE